MAITIDVSGGPDGTYTIEDDGTPGNNTSIVRRPDGIIFTTFAHPADSLTILSRAGQSIDVNITDSLAAANVTIGSLTNAAVNPDDINVGFMLTSGIVTLAARNAVAELGDDAATDIVAVTLLLDAGAGIGEGNAIETQVNVLEAETVTGGIALNNIGNLTIGGAAGTADLRGLFSGSAGDVVLTNQGSILLSDETGFESAHSAGNLSLSAIGAASDISSNVNKDALFARDNIVLNAGRDILFGTVGTDFDNDVRAGSGITISAGRDFTIDGFSDLAADDQGLASGGGVSITAGRDINIDDAHGTDASIAVSAFAGTGAVVLTTGLGGTLNLAATSTAAIQGRDGGVVVNADRILIEADSGISVSGTGTATLTTASAGRAVNIGSLADGATAMELSDAELDRVFAGTVIVGGDRTGEVTVVNAISSSSANFEVRSGANVVVKADVSASNSVTLQAKGNVTQKATSAITTTTFTARVDTPDDDAAGNTVSLVGTVTATGGGLFGNNDADTLRGSAGADVMHGLKGDDTYIVNDLGDQVIEAKNQGIDLVRNSVSFSLAGQFADNMLLTGIDNINGTGNTLANTLTGNSGNNVLDGGAGLDTLVGNLGNDTYVVDRTGDVVTEAAGEGTDTVQATVSLTLAANVENLLLLGTANLNGTGNDLDNTLTGNSGNNTLNGKLGSDTLAGGLGDDTYIIDHAGVTIVEASGEGTDLVKSALTFNLGGKQVENLTLTGSDDINGTGNSFDNTITGNAGNNILNGAGGADTLIGLGGNDTYTVDNPADQVIEANGGGIDLVQSSATFSLAGQFAENLTLTGNLNVSATGNTLANTIIGNTGNNVLNGGLQSDALTGNAGDDTFAFTTAIGGANIDSITDFNVADDTIRLDSAIFNTIVGTGTLSLAQFIANTSGTAQDASDRIIYVGSPGTELEFAL